MIRPMLLQHADDNFVLDKGWVLELKYDGVRAILDTTGDALTLTTRRGVDITFQFPEVTCEKGLILDGEIVGFDGEFHKLNWVQRRLGVMNRDKVLERTRKFPIKFVAFDILNDLSLDLEKRLENLSHVEPTAGLEVSPFWPASDVDKLWGYVRKNNLEGLVAKKLDSHYVEGRRSYDWRKIKHEKPTYRSEK